MLQQIFYCHSLKLSKKIHNIPIQERKLQPKYIVNTPNKQKPPKFKTEPKICSKTTTNIYIKQKFTTKQKDFPT